MNLRSVASLSDHALLHRLAELVSQDRQTTVALLMHLGEVEARKLYLPAGFASMHVYCVRELHMSDDVTYKRIRVARLGRVYPVILEALAEGRLHMSAVLSLSAHLSPGAVDQLVADATHKTRDEVDLMLAQRFPQPDLAGMVRSIPPSRVSAPPAMPQAGAAFMQPAPGRAILTEAEQVSAATPPLPTQIQLQSRAQLPAPAAPPPARPRVTPLAPERFALQLTMDQATHDKLRYAQALLGHAVPSGDLSQLLGRALDALIHVLEKRKFGAAARTRPVGSRGKSDERYIPVSVRSEVWRRDGGQCTFTSEAGHRCESRTRLEFDHIQTVARGGGYATASELRLRCRAHNQYEAERVFGTGFMERKRQEARRARERARGSAQGQETGNTQPPGMVREHVASAAYDFAGGQRISLLISGARHHDT